jgi:uncharacterized spore protein YtfJ
MDVTDLLRRAGENLSVSRSFGTAYEKDGLFIIPVALVAGGGGGGGPVAAATDESNDDPSETTDSETTDSDASGAGFGGLVMPVGAYVVKDEDVRWVPAVNVTLIALAAIAVLRVALRSKRHSRHHG